jgi:CubicO group peptidase (beta-lactamase class C family)
MTAMISSPTSVRAGAILREVKATASRRMKALKVPGVAIGIVHDGSVDTAGLGVTNIDDPQPITERTQFSIGSATKPFTSTVVLKMAERGELDLEAPIRRYLPDFQVADVDASERARVIDLFQHRTGWRGDFFDDVSSGEDALEKAVRAMRFLPQRTPYGKVWAYLNSNYIIAGRLIQVVSRARSYEQRVKDELLVPLGMSHTSFFMAELMADRFAVGHGAVYDGESEPRVSFAPLPRAAFPAGALISNVGDMMKWVRFQFDGKDEDGRQLLSPSLLHLAHSRLVEGELDEYMGVAWFVEDIGGVRVVSHAGRVQGFTAKVLFAPEQRFGIVVLTNGDRGIEVYDAVIAQAMKSYLGIQKESPKEVPARRADLEPFVGTWVGDLEDYRLYFEGDRLKARRLFKPAWAGAPKAFENPPPISMGSAGKDLCIMTDGPYAGVVGELLRDEAGKPQFLRLQHRIFRSGDD